MLNQQLVFDSSIQLKLHRRAQCLRLRLCFAYLWQARWLAKSGRMPRMWLPPRPEPTSVGCIVAMYSVDITNIHQRVQLESIRSRCTARWTLEHHNLWWLPSRPGLSDPSLVDLIELIIWGLPLMGVPKMDGLQWFMMENPIKMI